MKKILLTLTILISLTSCDWKKSSSTEKNVMENEKGEPYSDTLLLDLSDKQKEELTRNKINALYQSELSKCSQNVNAVTDFNGKTELWRICKPENGKRIIQIASHEENTLYEEVYFEKNSELIYAEESIKYIPINHFVLQPWTCQFYAKKGELISIMSLGHGKTEDDEWNPEIIFEMHKKRIMELNKIAQ